MPEAGTPERSEIDNSAVGPVSPKLDLTRGLAGWWKFDEKSGKVANDSSGKIRTGKLVGYSSDTTQWSKGVIGNALSFDGKGSHVDIGDFEFGDVCSVSVWAKWESIHRYSRIMNLENQFTFGNTFSYSNLQMYFENDSSSTRIVRAEGDELDGFWNKNRWVHAVIVLEKDSQLKIFKNGKFIKFRQVTTPKRVLRTSQVWVRISQKMMLVLKDNWMIFECMTGRSVPRK